MIHERKNGKTKSIQAAGAIVHKQARKPKLTYSDKLINEIREMIETSCTRVAQTVNVGMMMLYWQIGCRIHRDILKEKRVEYGAEIVASLSRQLVAEYFGLFRNSEAPIFFFICTDRPISS